MPTALGEATAQGPNRQLNAVAGICQPPQWHYIVAQLPAAGSSRVHAYSYTLLKLEVKSRVAQRGIPGLLVALCL